MGWVDKKCGTYFHTRYITKRGRLRNLVHTYLGSQTHEPSTTTACPIQAHRFMSAAVVIQQDLFMAVPSRDVLAFYNYTEEHTTTCRRQRQADFKGASLCEQNSRIVEVCSSRQRTVNSVRANVPVSRLRRWCSVHSIF